MKGRKRKHIKKVITSTKVLEERKMEGEKWINVFNCFDTDRSDNLDVDELKDLFFQLGIPKEATQIRNLIKQYKKGESKDEMKNPFLNVEEFVDMMMDQQKKKKRSDEETLESDIQNAFYYFDKNKDHQIQLSDVKDALMSLKGENLNEEIAESFVFEADEDGDGEINIEEFRKIMKSWCGGKK